MKISKLAFEALTERGELTDLEMWQGRYTGNTTGYILEFIGKCMQNPDKPFKFEHSTHHMQNMYAFNTMCNMINDMELKHLYIRKASMSLTYEPFMEVKKVVTWVEV